MQAMNAIPTRQVSTAQAGGGGTVWGWFSWLLSDLNPEQHFLDVVELEIHSMSFSMMVELKRLVAFTVSDSRGNVS